MKEHTTNAQETKGHQGFISRNGGKRKSDGTKKEETTNWKQNTTLPHHVKIGFTLIVKPNFDYISGQSGREEKKIQGNVCNTNNDLVGGK